MGANQDKRKRGNEIGECEDVINGAKTFTFRIKYYAKANIGINEALRHHSRSKGVFWFYGYSVTRVRRQGFLKFAAISMSNP